MTAHHGKQEPEETEDRLVRVADVWDEATATLLCDFLKDQGILATPQSAQIPAFGMIERAGSGHWGYVEVLERDESRARTLVEDFFRARPARDTENGEAEG